MVVQMYSQASLPQNFLDELPEKTLTNAFVLKFGRKQYFLAV